MKNVKQPQATPRKRKAMLVLPVLIIPFLTGAFWALGGGKGNSQLANAPVSQGLNTTLPDANRNEEKLLDKLGFYNKADKDSAKLAEWMRSDPYYNRKEDTVQHKLNELEQLTQASAAKYNQRLNVSPYEPSNQTPEAQVMQKLTLLQKQLDANTAASTKMRDDNSVYSSRPKLAGDADRLELLMNGMTTGRSVDPDMAQLSGVMDKILDVQHPDRVTQRLKERETAAPSNVLSVSSMAVEDTIANGFFGLEAETTRRQSNAIEAVVQEAQVLVNGAVIKLRLLQDIYISGAKIPAGNFVFGLAALNGERLQVEINSIRCGTSLYPVKMDAYDMDGLSGIYIPGAITRDVVKQAADNSLQKIELPTLDPSLKAQAAAVGISTAKSLLSRKVKLTKVLVKAGYKLLLKDKSIQQ